jgi:trk system potassium uptake protein TrkH
MFKKLLFFTPTELTVLSFIAVSIIGGLILMFTEKNRIVQAVVPYHQKVRIQPIGGSVLQLSGGLRYAEELHTVTKIVAYKGEAFIDTWFTAVSALCVTGLTSTDFSKFTLIGQIITLLLIQIGGLGIIVFTSLLAIALFRNVSERATFRTLLASILDTEHHDVRDMLRYVFIYTFIFELIGFLIMGIYLQWFADQNLLNGINPWWWALFHSISAFNNAGFALLNNNLMSFVTDPIINVTIAGLIILGGLGYPVLIYIYLYFRTRILKKHNGVEKRLRSDFSGVASLVQVKVALVGTVILLAAGTMVTYFTEVHNPVMKSFNPAQLFLVSFFQSVSTRTAGFNTVDVGALHVATLFFYMLLMYIGANPAGTAGGIKIPTVAVLYGYIKDWFMKPGLPVILYNTRISKFSLSHAIRLFSFSSLFIAFIILLMSYLERDYLITPDPTFNFTKIMFEVFSAFGTVGMTMGFAGGVTSFAAILTPMSKLLLILTMLIGRIGPLTLLASLPWKRRYYLTEPKTKDHQDVTRIQIG